VDLTRDGERLGATHEVPGDVENVHADVDERAAAGSNGVGEPTVETLRHAPGSRPHRAGVVNIAQRAGANALTKLLRRRLEPTLQCEGK
jgi:hypothetical protein